MPSSCERTLSGSLIAGCTHIPGCFMAPGLSLKPPGEVGLHLCPVQYGVMKIMAVPFVSSLSAEQH